MDLGKRQGWTSGLGVGLSLFLSVVATGCGSDSASETGTVTPELQRIGAITGSNLMLQTRLQAASNPHLLVAVPVNSDITVETLKLPIKGISLKNSTSGSEQAIYECSGTTDAECQVDLASGSALTNLLSSSLNSASGSVAADTYDYIRINYCQDGASSYTAKLKAKGNTDSAAPGTVVYYTKTGSENLTTVAGEYGEVEISFAGCLVDYPIPSPVTVTKDSTVALKLLFHGYGIARFGVGDGTLHGAGTDACGGDGCTWRSTPYANGTFAALNYLQVVPTIDTGTPTTEFYRVSRHLSGQTDNMVGLIGLIFNSSSQYVGGFMRSYYDTVTGVSNTSFGGAVGTFAETSSGVYTLATSAPSASPSTPFLTISAFQRVSSQTALTCTDYEGQTFECDMTKITP